MTVIAGVVCQDGVVIGSDRMASSCRHKSDFGTKIFERDGWAFACCGSVREIQIVAALTKTKKVHTHDEVISLANEIYEELKNKGLGCAHNGQMPRCTSGFLIATVEGLFCVDDDMSVRQYEKYHADGIGYEYALAILHDGFRQGEPTDPVELVARSITTANDLNPHCGGGPDIVRIVREEKPQKSGTLKKEMGDGARK